ncbi:transglycosylase SLT domain-containing protein [Alkalinema pantanalense CENA528]|uniref:lytic transglycosylase domain-containing protein n=1 Tax=Alkalinema pantanalense TaxID=1620705 RepID=UPI003D6E6318
MDWKEWPQRKLVGTIIVGLGIASFGVGALVSTTVKTDPNGRFQFMGITSPFPNSNGSSSSNTSGEPSAVSELINKPSSPQRTEALKKFATAAQPSLDRDRARYLLANEAIEAGQAQAAIDLLKDLETHYRAMAAPILMQRGRAYEAAGQKDPAIATYQAILQQFPKDPTAAEALFHLGKILGKSGVSHWDRAIAQFPSHPRAIEIAKLRLQDNPKLFPMQLHLAKYDYETRDYTSRTEKFLQTYSKQLKPEDWAAIAFGLWENQKYDLAAAAYARAPETALTAYRAARGLHLTGQPGSQQRYQAVVQKYPKTPEAGLALTRLAQLAEKPQEAIAYLDQVIAHYPDKAPEAIVSKANALEKLGSPQSASQLRQFLLQQHSSSEAAAELRWKIAQDQAKGGKLPAAQQWVEAILKENSTSPIAAKAGFWGGKWAQQSGQNQQASNHYQSVIKLHPESYYAWRSASRLGWDVGDFDNVRQLQPAVVRPKMRDGLLAGSETLRELHHLGFDRGAWNYWQVEFQNRQQPSVAEQFTDGVLRLGVGDNLDGLFMVSNLNDRESASDRQQVATLRKDASYWQALYPFPYMAQIESWSRQRQLNPMLVTALIRQESRFEPQIKSSVGATGLMQVMPDTASYIASQIKLKEYKLDRPEDNIKLGTWYLNYTHQEYSGNSMLAVASYNAGPGAVGGWLAKSKTQDADEFVEAIPYDETRGYVKAVFENYWNYLRLYNPSISQKVAQVSPEHPRNLF